MWKLLWHSPDLISTTVLTRHQARQGPGIGPESLRAVIAAWCRRVAGLTLDPGRADALRRAIEQYERVGDLRQDEAFVSQLRASNLYRQGDRRVRQALALLGYRIPGRRDTFANFVDPVKRQAGQR